MRYQVFNQRGMTEPVFSAPWKWLATALCNLLSTEWGYCRLVDSRTGETLMESATAARGVTVKDETGQSGGAAFSHITIGKRGNVHEVRFGTTRYGNGKVPPGGHRPQTTIESEGDER